MIVRDWKDAAPSDMQRLYAREQDYWTRELHWDAAAAWQEIEQARVGWGLRGCLAIDGDNAIRGWAYCLVEESTAHLGAVVADTPEATAALVDACLEVALGRTRPVCVSCFGPGRATGVESVLESRGFRCEPYHYMSRPIAVGAGALDADPWTAADVEPAARLFGAAYGPSGRHFAPHGTREEWEQYARTLVDRAGCGVMEPAVTRVLRSAEGMEALVLATRVAPDTVHLAQVAVHPSRRREGLARKLVEEACAAGAAGGATRATLLVGDSNRPARALYAGLGFAETAVFLAGLLDA
jgi:ribosomal protein S18 acetylase RimI-like enzyme